MLQLGHVAALLHSTLVAFICVQNRLPARRWLLGRLRHLILLNWPHFLASCASHDPRICSDLQGEVFLLDWLDHHPRGLPWGQAKDSHLYLYSHYFIVLCTNHHQGGIAVRIPF
jgi:hypothetical protein